MSYVTHNDDGGAAASMGDFLVNKLGSFAANEALWVANRSPASLTLPEAELYTHAGSVGVPTRPYLFARCTGRTLLLGLGTGIDTAEEWYDQPGNPGISPNLADPTDYEPGASFFEGNMRRSQMQAVNNTVTGALAGHHLFTDGDGDSVEGSYCHAVIQLAAKQWRHYLVGMMTKFGAFTGGQYVIGHYWHESGNGSTANDSGNRDDPYDVEHIPPWQNTAHTATSGQATSEDGVCRSPMFEAAGLRAGIEWWASVAADAGGEFGPVDKARGTINDGTESIGNGAIVGGGDFIGGTLFLAESNLAAKARPLVPLVFFGKFLFEGQERWGPIGQIPDVYRINMRNLSAGEAITIGSDTYRVFPLVNTDPAVGSDLPYSGYEGLAYKVVPAAP